LKLSLSNGVFCKCSLEENLTNVKQLGFENLEFNMKCVEEEDEDSVYVAKKLIDAYELKCLTLHAATLHVKTENEIPKALYYGRVSADFAHKLSAPILVVHSNVSRKLPQSQRKEFLKEIFGEMKPYAEGLNLKLALENLSYASSGYGKNPAEIDEIFEVIDEDRRMGVTLDFCHATATGQTYNLLQKYHSRLCNVHLSDRAHKPFAEETSYLSEFLGELYKHEYNGPITMELKPNCTTQEILNTKIIIEKTLKNQGYRSQTKIGSSTGSS
jgi:sugar phosphate isomerase/epimerase